MYFRVIIIYFIFFLGIESYTYSQDKRKLYVTQKIETAPEIDGYLSEEVWKLASTDTSFFQYTPFNGYSPSEITQFKILYDNKALYIGAFMYDNQADSIIKNLGRRDDGLELNADQFLIEIGPYDDGVNSYTFMVSSSGVQTDIKNYFETKDISWDAVWKSKTRITPVGWSVEIKIPYSALHFANIPVQVWSLNLFRVLKRHEETDSWNFVNRDIKGITNQSGQLIGIKNIKPALRLSLIPFVTGYSDYNPEKNTWNSHVKGGLDLQYGINQSFTLNATILPDYGQLEYDEQILNLSAFETRFEERRPFFSEGIEFFSKSNIFYSRRIGYDHENYNHLIDSLQNNEEVINYSHYSDLLNAIKISGRTPRKLGMGILNAITLPEYVTVLDSTNGSTHDIEKQYYKNYNVLAVDKALPNNSFLSFVNTNMMHFKRNYNANVTGTEFKFSNSEDSYAISGLAALSQIFVNKKLDQIGFKSDIYFDKTSGSFQFRIGNEIISKDYNQNDMGYLPYKNEMSSFISLIYNIFKPFWKIYSWRNDIEVRYSTLYQPRSYTDFKLSLNSKVLFSNQLKISLQSYWRPYGNHDYYDARNPLRVFKKTESYYGHINLQSDTRKTLSIKSSYSHWASTSSLNLVMNSFNINPQVRIKKRTQLGLDLYYYQFINSIGYVNTIADTIFIGKRNIHTLSPSINFLYSFTNKAWLNIKFRHYRSTVSYDRFYILNDNGKLDVSNNYTLPANIDFQNFTMDFILKWEFAPGSLISFVWKNKIDNHRDIVSGNYFYNVQQLLSQRKFNNISLRILYYFDFSYINKTKLKSSNNNN